MRHKRAILYNFPSVLEKPFKLVASVLSSKLRGRIEFVSKSDLIPGIERDNLPKEMGGTELTTQEMLDLWKKELERNKLTETLGKMNRFEYKKQLQEDFEEMNGSFRKLEVD